MNSDSSFPHVLTFGKLTASDKLPIAAPSFNQLGSTVRAVLIQRFIRLTLLPHSLSCLALWIA